jgi:hypothetical protein
MMPALGGSEEIERTLRLERAAVERLIARFRVWFFGVVMATSALRAGASSSR